MKDRWNERHSPLKCQCGGQLVRVLDSRPHEIDSVPSIKRRRECEKCGERSTTHEITELQMESLKVELRKELIVRLMADV